MIWEHSCRKKNN